MALLGIAIGALLLALGLALFLVLAPVLLAGFFYVRWKLRRAVRDLQQQQAEAMRRAAETRPGGVIDAEYVVIEDGERRRP